MGEGAQARVVITQDRHRGDFVGGHIVAQRACFGQGQLAARELAAHTDRVLAQEQQFARGFERVHDTIVMAFNDPGVKQTMARQGNTINIRSVEQAQPGFRTAMAKYAALVKKAGIQPEQAAPGRRVGPHDAPV